MRILLAEDDELVRSVVADDLRERGLEVVEAGTGVEALMLYHKQDARARRSC